MASISLFENGKLPVGRLVWGSVDKVNDTDAQGRPRTTLTGQPKSSYDFGVAYPKTPGATHFSQEPWFAALWAEGHRGTPNAGQFPHFAWKVKDGDSAIPDKSGKAPNTKTGYPGHWVVSFSSSFAPGLHVLDNGQVRQWGSRGPQQPDDPIVPGHYVQVQGTVQHNGNAQSPGVFVNHQLVCRVGFGAVISSGPDAAAVGFGSGVALPAGASATPVGMPAAPVVPPAAPAGMPPPPVMPSPPPLAVAPPVVPVVPQPGFLAPPTAVPVPPPTIAPPPAAPVAPTMTAKAGGVPYESFIAQGWNDTMLRAEGYMV